MFTCNPGYLSPRWPNHVHQTTPLTVLSTWPCHQQSCSLNQVSQTGETAVYLTNQANHVKLLSTLPDLWQWSSPSQTGQLGEDVHLTISSTKTSLDQPSQPVDNSVHLQHKISCHPRWLDQVTQPRRLKVTHPCNSASQLTLMFTWPIRPSRPNRWHVCSLNQLGQSGGKVVHLTILSVLMSTWPIQSTRWPGYQPDQPNYPGQPDEIGVLLTIQVTLLVTRPYHEQWSSPYLKFSRPTRSTRWSNWSPDLAMNCWESSIYYYTPFVQ